MEVFEQQLIVEMKNETSIGSLIKRAIEQRMRVKPYYKDGELLSWQKVAAEIGTSKSNLYYMFRQDTIQTKFYKEICDKILDVPYDYLLGLSDSPSDLVQINLETARSVRDLPKVLAKTKGEIDKIKAEYESEIMKLTNELEDKKKIIKLYEDQVNNK
jgi:AraC-like DNA-binding protein